MSLWRWLGLSPAMSSADSGNLTAAEARDIPDQLTQPSCETERSRARPTVWLTVILRHPSEVPVLRHPHR